MRRWMLIALCMLSFPCAASPGPAERAEAFLTTIGRGDPDKAFDDLFAGSGIADRRPEQVETLRSQARAALELYGKPIGFEKVRE